jgi:poly(3-hydroxybutyrate) depolymerase
MRTRGGAVAAVLAAAASLVPGTCTGQSLRSVRCAGQTRRYLLSSPAGNALKPALLLLHGAGGHAGDLVPLWSAFAASHGIVLVAPELPRDRAFENVAPEVFRCIVEDAKTAAKVDPRRVYVFGHSMGGYLAFDAAMFESEYFAAVVAHAAGIDDDYAGILARARRKIPIAIIVGDRDAPGTVLVARSTRELLSREGFPVEFEELSGHDHNFNAFAERIVADAWRFLESKSLP